MTVSTGTSYLSIRPMSPEEVVNTKSGHGAWFRLSTEQRKVLREAHKIENKEYYKWVRDMRITTQFRMSDKAKADKQIALFSARYPALTFRAYETTPLFF